MTFDDFAPDHELVLSLEPEELAGILLQYLVETNNQTQINAQNFAGQYNFAKYPHAVIQEVQKAVMEAWVWLEREGMLAHLPESYGGGWEFVTRRGKANATPTKLKAYRSANLLPQKMLHASIAQSVWAMFARGEYEAAVFQSFKQLEVAIRDAAQLSPSDIGVDLARKAFKPNVGVLADHNALVAEQEALSNLMAGALGSYKNPHSHRSVSVDAHEAVEMLFLASHLIGIVEKRTR